MKNKENAAKKVIALLIPLIIFLGSALYLDIGVFKYCGFTFETFCYMNYYLREFLKSDQFTLSYVFSLVTMITSGISFLIIAKKVG